MVPRVLCELIFKYCGFYTQMVLGHVCKGLQTMTHLAALSVDPAYYNTTPAARTAWDSSHINCTDSKHWLTIIKRINPAALRLDGWSASSIHRLMSMMKANPCTHTLSIVDCRGPLDLVCSRMTNLKNLSLIGGDHNILGLPYGLRMLYVDGCRYDHSGLGEWREGNRHFLHNLYSVRIVGPDCFQSVHLYDAVFQSLRVLDLRSMNFEDYNGNLAALAWSHVSLRYVICTRPYDGAGYGARPGMVYSEAMTAFRQRALSETLVVEYNNYGYRRVTITETDLLRTQRSVPIQVFVDCLDLITYTPLRERLRSHEYFDRASSTSYLSSSSSSSSSPASYTNPHALALASTWTTDRQPSYHSLSSPPSSSSSSSSSSISSSSTSSTSSSSTSVAASDDVIDLCSDSDREVESPSSSSSSSPTSSTSSSFTLSPSSSDNEVAVSSSSSAASSSSSTSSSSSSSLSSVSQRRPQGGWKCKACTLMNENSDVQCDACRTKRGKDCIIQ
jgi:hypothetical protein